MHQDMHDDMHSVNGARADEPDITAVLSGLGHELRNPIHAIEGFAGLLCDTDLDADQRILADSIRSSVGALSTMVADVFDFARFDAGEVPIDPRPFDLRDLVEEVHAAASLTLSGTVRMIVTVDPSLPMSVVGDAARIRQILTNLVGNAVKYTMSGTVSLTVGTALRSVADGRHVVVFDVADTGIGIPADLVPRLFRPFERGPRPAIDRIAGTGLGLSISLRLAQAMSGTIGVTSEVGVGSTFTLTLPLETDGIDPPRPLDGVRASVAGPDAPTVESYETMLIGLGADLVPIAESDLVLLDVLSDVMSGLVDRIGPSATVVVCSERPPEPPMHPRVRWVRTPLRRRSLLDAIGAGAADDGSEVTSPSGRILVVEDDAANRQVARLVLTRAGYEVDATADGSEALAALATTTYDLVLLDCHLPGVDGFEVARTVRQREAAHATRRTPIVAFTGTISPVDRTECYAAGMDDVLGKPAPGTELLAVIGRWLQPD